MRRRTLETLEGIISRTDHLIKETNVRRFTELSRFCELLIYTISNTEMRLNAINANECIDIDAFIEIAEQDARLQSLCLMANRLFIFLKTINNTIAKKRISAIIGAVATCLYHLNPRHLDETNYISKCLEPVSKFFIGKELNDIRSRRTLAGCRHSNDCHHILIKKCKEINFILQEMKKIASFRIATARFDYKTYQYDTFARKLFTNLIALTSQNNYAQALTYPDIASNIKKSITTWLTEAATWTSALFQAHPKYMIFNRRMQAVLKDIKSERHTFFAHRLDCTQSAESPNQQHQLTTVQY